VHDWALWPLIVGSALLGLILLATGTYAQTGTFAITLTHILVAVGLQLFPLPTDLVLSTGDGIERSLRSYDLAFAAAPDGLRPVSIAPQLTWRAMLIFLGFFMFTVGLSAQLSSRSELPKQLSIRICLLALLVALFALIQKATFNRKIYWLWESEFQGSINYYGPFVNRNHFAGWMLLAGAVTAGLLVARIQTSARHIKPGWRNRVLWLSEKEAGQLVLIAVTLMVMLMSVMWSLSRSGIASTAVALLVLGLSAARRIDSSGRRLVVASTVSVLMLVAVAWRGTDILADWYGRTNTFEWRVRLWQDTLPALKDFWLVGSGINTYGALMLLYPQTDNTVHAMQAHNDYLQLAVEGGLLVGIPALITVGLLVRTIRRRLAQPQDEMTRWIRMGAVAGLCGMALQETVEFSLQIPGVALLFAVLLAIAIHEPAPPERPRRAPDRRHHHGDAGLTSIR
jgi:O-antigen ligase